MRVAVCSGLLLAALGCSKRHSLDGGELDGGGDVDAGMPDGGGVDAPAQACPCEPGPHEELIFLMSDEGELWSFDPVTLEAAFVVGPVCGGQTPYSMAVDGAGTAWVLFVESLSMQTFSVADPGPCVDSPYVRRDPGFGLFGMSFATRSATDACAELFVHTYDGEGPFSEGPDFGRLGAIDPVTGALRAIGSVDYDGGELTGTGDGRLFAFAGVDPVDLVEYDKTTAEPLEVIPLDGVRKTSASAAAFFAGDIYLFTEAPPPGCASCLDAACPTEHAACLADDACADALACAIDQGDVTDECGGLLLGALSCFEDCTGECLLSRLSRVSRVLRYDLDASSGSRVVEPIVDMLPIRVVGAASSPCVPVGPI